MKSTYVGFILIICGIFSLSSGVSLPITNWILTDASTSMIITILLIALGLIALLGGFCSLRHKWYVLTFIGAMCAIGAGSFLSRHSAQYPGILMILPHACYFLAGASMILLAFSNNEFKRDNSSEKQRK